LSCEVRPVGQLAACLERLRERHQYFADLVVADHPRQSVAAKEQHVSTEEIDVGEVDLNALRRAEGLKNDVVVLEGLGFFFRELASLDQLIYQRLVARHLNEPVSAQEVRAAVSHLPKEEPGVHECGDGRGRPHPPLGAVRLGFGEDSHARRLDRVDQARGDVVPASGRLPREHPLVDDIDGQLARDFARGGASHPVANPEDRTPGPDLLPAITFHQSAATLGEVRHQEVVLVVLSDLAHVGASEDADLDGFPGLWAGLFARGWFRLGLRRCLRARLRVGARVGCDRLGLVEQVGLLVDQRRLGIERGRRRHRAMVVGARRVDERLLVGQRKLLFRGHGFGHGASVIGLRSWSGLEPEQVLTYAQLVVRMKLGLFANGHVRAVRGIEVFDGEGAGRRIASDRRVSPGQKGVRREHDVTHFTTEDRLVTVEMVHVAHEPRDGSLLETCDYRHWLATEDLRPVLDRWCGQSLLLRHEVER
jgi:hypothetical protein